MAEQSKKSLIGRVVSDKMSKTIVVQVDRKKRHPLYDKIINVSKKYKVHDEENEASIGDVVRILESRPLSKEKRWRMDAILERAIK